MSRKHEYRITTTWKGNLGEGTVNYHSYSRDHEVNGPNKNFVIQGSSAPSFRGDPTRYNPEELLVAAVSACHMLWVLHLCADAGIVLTAYEDAAFGVMVEETEAEAGHSGAGQITEVTLRPRIELADPARADQLPDIHSRAHELCFISRSIKSEVRIEPELVYA